MNSSQSAVLISDSVTLRSVLFLASYFGSFTMQIKTNATARQNPNKLIITIAFVFFCYYRNGVITAIVTKAEKFVNEFRMPQLIASPILGVKPTSSSKPIKPIGQLKKPIKLIATETRILS